MRCNALPVRRGISASFLERVESPKGRGGRAGGDGGCGASETNCVGLGVRSPGSKAWLGPDIDKRATANSTLNIGTRRSLSRIHPLQRRFSPTLLPDQIKRALPEQKKTTSSPPGQGTPGGRSTSKCTHCPGVGRSAWTQPAGIPPTWSDRPGHGSARGKGEKGRASATVGGNAHQNSRAEAPALRAGHAQASKRPKRLHLCTYKDAWLAWESAEADLLSSH